MNKLLNHIHNPIIVSKKCPWGKNFVNRIIAANDPVNKVDPLGLCVAPFCQDKWDVPDLPSPSLPSLPSNSCIGSSRAYGYFTDWLSGNGGTLRFGEGHCTTEIMKDNYQIGKIREEIIAEMNSQCAQDICRPIVYKNDQNYSYQDAFFNGVPYLSGVGKVMRAAKYFVLGIHGFAKIDNFVGGFDFKALGEGDCKNKKAFINFEVTNKTGWNSFTRLPWMQPGKGLIDNVKSGFGADMNQIWEWKEEVELGGNVSCKCE